MSRRVNVEARASRPPKYALRQRADHGGGARVGLPGPLGVISQQHRRIMTAPCGYDVDRHTAIEQRRLMAPPQIVETQLSEAEFACAADEASVTACGSRGLVKSNSAPAGDGKINAPSGSRTRNRSTSAPSGTPATRRRCFSRSTSSKAMRSSSIAMVRTPRWSLRRALKVRLPSGFLQRALDLQRLNSPRPEIGPPKGKNFVPTRPANAAVARRVQAPSRGSRPSACAAPSASSTAPWSLSPGEGTFSTRAIGLTVDQSLAHRRPRDKRSAPCARGAPFVASTSWKRLGRRARRPRWAWSCWRRRRPRVGTT